jgi:hypothetical protein
VPLDDPDISPTRPDAPIARGRRQLPGLPAWLKRARAPVWVWLLLVAAGIAVLRPLLPLGEPASEIALDGVILRRGDASLGDAGLSIQERDIGGLREAREILANVRLRIAVGKPDGDILGVPFRVRDSLEVSVDRELGADPNTPGSNASTDAATFLADRTRVRAVVERDLVRLSGRSDIVDLLSDDAAPGPRERTRITIAPVLGSLLWIVVAGLIIAAAILASRPSPRTLRARAIAGRKCPRCGYELLHIPRNACHKCGEPLTVDELAILRDLNAKVIDQTLAAKREKSPAATTKNTPSR